MLSKVQSPFFVEVQPRVPNEVGSLEEHLKVAVSLFSPLAPGELGEVRLVQRFLVIYLYNPTHHHTARGQCSGPVYMYNESLSRARELQQQG